MRLDQIISFICLASVVLRASAREETILKALQYLEDHERLFDEELIELGSIPSISSLSEHGSDVTKAGDWVADRLKKAGLEVCQ